MSELLIRVHGVPAPQGSKRHLGNGIMVESSKRVKPWREAVKHATLDTNHCPSFEHRHDDDSVCLPIPGPVKLDVAFLLPRPKGHYRTGRFAHLLRDSAPWYPAGKPDLDKLLRSTMDGLGEAGVWRDDCQVVYFDQLVKLYATELEAPGAIIRIRPARRVRVGDDNTATAEVAS